MKCEKCGYEITDNSKFCNNCGAPVTQSGSDWVKTSSVPTTPHTKKPKKKRGAIVLVIVAVLVWIMAINNGDDGEESTTSDNTVQEETVDTAVQNKPDKKNTKEVDPKKEESKKEEKEKPKKTEKPKETKSPKEIKKQYMKSCKEYEYKKVLRNPDKYIGKRVKIRVKISSVHEKDVLTPTKYYFAYTNDEYDMWSGDEYGIFDKRESGDPKLLEDDVIDVYGEIAKPEETKSLIVNSQELFCIDMKYTKLISE